MIQVGPVWSRGPCKEDKLERRRREEGERILEAEVRVSQGTWVSLEACRARKQFPRSSRGNAVLLAPRF